MPVGFTTYSLSADRLFVDQELIKLKNEETLLYRVRDMSFSQTVLQRIFGVGSVISQSSDKTSPVLELKISKMLIRLKKLFMKMLKRRNRKEECVSVKFWKMVMIMLMILMMNS